MNQDSLRSLLDDLEQRNLTRRSFLARSVALGLSARAVGLLLGAAGATGAVARVSAQEQGGTFTFAVTTDPETLDPQKTTNSAAYTVFDEIYSTLVYQDLDLSYKGLLAESWTTSDDNLSITFTLREGIIFHDGSSFNADSVKYTFERLQNEGARSPIYEDVLKISAIDVVDDKTVTLTFSEPSATFFNAISNGYGGILSESAVTAAGDDYGRQAVGTNGYRLGDWTTGSLVSLTAFPDFAAPKGYYENQGPPHIETLAFKVLPESFSQVASLEAGEIDAVDLTAADVPRIENDDRFEIYTSKSSGITYLSMNATRPVLEDLKVRQAIAHAIDRDEIVTAVFDGGLAEPVYTALPPSIPGYNEELVDLMPHFDPEKSKSLLAEAGWKTGDDGIAVKDGAPLKITMHTTTATTRGQMATLIQAQLRNVGIDLEIKQLELAALLDFTPAGDHDLILLGYVWGEPDALSLFLSTERIGASNDAHYSNPTFDDLLHQGQQELNEETRLPIYTDAQKILIEDLPWVPLIMPINKTAVAKRVEDVKVFPTGGLLLYDAHIGD
ncbi:MAG TPA: ABC transporter substrate-binding protein [Thermomicrobiales bacterium]|nr:ABC transporter substrate-binding protein [Thermomicrobiales bacterium]